MSTKWHTGNKLANYCVASEKCKILFPSYSQQLKQYFSFEVQILDDKTVRRRFRASNYQPEARLKPYICTFPLALEDGWNQVVIDLAAYTKKAYGTTYTQTLQVEVRPYI